MSARDESGDEAIDRLVTRHLRIGWSALVVFGALGLLLEALHGFKVRWLVDVSNETRRLMWTLAHAHGTLLGVVHLAFAATLGARPMLARAAFASSCLSAALIAIPAGFLLGGAFAHAGDPGLGIVLVPIGAVAFLAGCGVVARALWSSGGADQRREPRAARRARPNDVSGVK